MKEILNKLLIDDILPNDLLEVEWLINGLNSSKRDPIMLSIGESWSDIPLKLKESLTNLPAYANGYLLSVYGLPEFRSEAKKYMIKQHKLITSECLFEVAVSTGGTKLMMYTFARYIFKNKKGKNCPKAFIFSPGWGYYDVLEDIGFDIHILKLSQDELFIPDIAYIEEVLKEANIDSTNLIILNSQHNPTGINWDVEVVAKIIDLSIEMNFSIMIDDAHFNIHSENITPTSTLSILIDKLHNTKVDINWLWVQSLGKQFCCNGWGIGIVAANPKILNSLLNKYHTVYQHNINGLYQIALSKFLNSVEANKLVKDRNELIDLNRKILISNLISNLNYPKSLFPNSVCTTFQLIPIPLRYLQKSNPQREFIFSVFSKTNILFSNPIPSIGKNAENEKDLTYVRLYLGLDNKLFEEAIGRMIESNIVFDN